MKIKLNTVATLVAIFMVTAVLQLFMLVRIIEVDSRDFSQFLDSLFRRNKHFKRSHAVNPSLDYFLISDGTSLKIIDSDFNQEEIFRTQTNAVITAFGNYYNETFFWVGNTSDTEIQSFNQGHHSSPLQSRPWKPNTIAVDYLNKKVYTIDELAKINIYDTKTGRYSIILSDLRRPSDLALDCSRNLMFFAQSTSAIYRANLDGTGLTKVIDKPGITTVTVDPTVEPRMIYWASDDFEIETSDYSGKNRMVVLGLRMHISSLAVTNGSRLAWISPPTWTSGEAKLFIYEDIAGSGHVRFKNATLKDPRVIQHYVKSPPNNTDPNPCDDNNGGCEHLCLLDANKRPTCACQIGWRLELNLNSKTCWPIEEFLLYTQGAFIRGKRLDGPEKEAFTDAIVPIRLSSHRLGYRVIDFDYDLPTDSFIYTDYHRLYKENVIDGSKASKDFVGLKNLAVDWMTGNVYAMTDRFIMVYNHRRNSSVRRSEFPRLKYRPHSMTVHPVKGYVFFIAVDTYGKSHVYRINADLDIASMENIAEVHGLNATKLGIALDYDMDRLYQLYGMEVHYSNLAGQDVQAIDVSVVQNPISIAVHGKWMYVANMTSIWRLDKLSGHDAVRIAPKYGESLNEPISGVKVHSSLLQSVNYERHPCAANNGDCERFCFAVPGDGGNLTKICGCGDHEILQIDGTSCLRSEENVF